MDRIECLLKSGYFPWQLPPSFSTKDLAVKHAVLYSTWLEMQDPPKKGTRIPKAPNSKAELFSVARAGHQRRVTSLTNPIAQTYLSTHVATHWGDFLSHYRKSRLSVSRPRFIRHGNRAASISSMQLFYKNKITKSAGYRFMLKTDVSRFFPTIYTHSVPWAFHSKSTAKRNKNPTPKYFGNLIDLALRQGQDGQTIGIPIGPDTSHMIAEAIATSVDLELKKRLKIWPAGFRYVDDYYLFFSTSKEAEEALAALIRSLKEFELQTNFDKTITCPVIEITDDFWTHQLRSFNIANRGNRQSTDINHFFELSKDLARKNSDESVMLYALKKISSAIIRKEYWDIFEAHVCHVAIAFPNTLQMVARIFASYSRVGYPINIARLSRFVNASIEDHAPLGHHSEVAWCLWMTKEIGLSLSEPNIDRISEMHSSVCALLLLDIHQMGRLVKTPKYSYWKSFENKEDLYGDLWLLSYEAGLRGWAGFSDAHIISDPHFAVLHREDIHFYDVTATIPPLFHVKSEALKAYDVNNEVDFFKLPDIESFEDLVEHEETEWGYEGFSLTDYELEDTDSAEDSSDKSDDPFADSELI